MEQNRFYDIKAKSFSGPHSFLLMLAKRRNQFHFMSFISRTRTHFQMDLEGLV